MNCCRLCPSFFFRGGWGTAETLLAVGRRRCLYSVPCGRIDAGRFAVCHPKSPFPVHLSAAGPFLSLHFVWLSCLLLALEVFVPMAEELSSQKENNESSNSLSIVSTHGLADAFWSAPRLVSSGPGAGILDQSHPVLFCIRGDGPVETRGHCVSVPTETPPRAWSVYTFLFCFSRAEGIREPPCLAFPDSFGFCSLCFCDAHPSSQVIDFAVNMAKALINRPLGIAKSDPDFVRILQLIFRFLKQVTWALSSLFRPIFVASLMDVTTHQTWPSGNLCPVVSLIHTPKILAE